MAKKVLVVDDEVMITTTLSTLIKLMAKHDVVQCKNPAEAIELLKDAKFDMVISDFMMPQMNGLEFLKKAKEVREDCIRILLTGYADKENAIKSINEIGLYYYIEKPWDNMSLLKIIQNGLEKKNLTDELKKKIIELEQSNEEIKRLYDLLKKDYESELDNVQNVIISLANVLEAKDKYTDGHTRRVANISRELGKKLGLDEKRLNNMEIGGLIHDIGKVGIPEAILNKPGKLTDEEYEIIKKHTVIGENICRPLNCVSGCLDIIRHHHERPNGKGYPDGLYGDMLSTEARIVAVSDVFDALYSDRPYRSKMPIDKVKSIMKDEGEKQNLDPMLVSLLLEMIEKGELEEYLYG